MKKNTILDIFIIIVCLYIVISSIVMMIIDGVTFLQILFILIGSINLSFRLMLIKKDMSNHRKRQKSYQQALKINNDHSNNIDNSVDNSNTIIYNFSIKK